MRRPASWIPRMSLLELVRLRDKAHVYTCLSSSHTHVCTHIDSTSGLVSRTVLSPHTSASSVLPSPLPTRMSLHHLTPSHISHIQSLLLDVQRLSSVLSQASGMGHQAGLVCSPPLHPITKVSLTHDAASMQTQAAGQKEQIQDCRRYVALWSTVRAHRRHGRSLVQRP
jgi:hypothetical protein